MIRLTVCPFLLRVLALALPSASRSSPPPCTQPRDSLLAKLGRTYGRGTVTQLTQGPKHCSFPTRSPPRVGLTGTHLHSGKPIHRYFRQGPKGQYLSMHTSPPKPHPGGWPSHPMPGTPHLNIRNLLCPFLPDGSVQLQILDRDLVRPGGRDALVPREVLDGHAVLEQLVDLLPRAALDLGEHKVEEYWWGTTNTFCQLWVQSCSFLSRI